MASKKKNARNPAKRSAGAKGKSRAKVRAKGRAKPAVRRGCTGAGMPADLERRLMALAVQMEKTLDAVLLQALCEFADAWEDHFQTVEALQDDDRVQVAVR